MSNRPDYQFDDVPLDKLAAMIRYAADALAKTPVGALETVREDMIQTADLIIPAAEYVDTLRREGQSATRPLFLPPGHE